MVSKNPKQEAGVEEEEATERLNAHHTDDNVEYNSPGKGKKRFYAKSRLYMAAFFVLCLALAIIGIVLIVMATRKPVAPDDEETKGKYSAEAERVGLEPFMKRAWGDQYSVFLHEFNPSPEKIKEGTDQAARLLQELEDMNIDVDKLKLRERKGVEQMRLFLKHVFTTPYGTNYYAGDWMLGPNSFCMETVCKMIGEVNLVINRHDLDEPGLEKMKKGLQTIGRGFDQYVSNMKYGVQAGMVRSSVACKAGLTSLEREYFQIKLKGPRGILEESSIAEFFGLSLIRSHGSLPPEASELKEYLVKFIGQPVHNMLSYIRNEHLQYCVPTEVSSGLATLPLPYVYVNGTKDETRPTTGKLPTGEKINGKKAYEMIMPYFTTIDMTPTEVHELGWKMLKSLYSEVVESAKSFTGISDTESAVASMKRTINSSEMYFAINLPLNESDENAQKICISDETAQKHCPTRWAAFSKWMKAAREISSLIESKLTHLFYFTGQYKSTAACPVTMRFNYNPAHAFQSYQASTAACSLPATYFIPFWVDKPGPAYRMWTVNAHEASPGHHLQLQGYKENFLDAGSDFFSFMDTITSMTAFVEGWGLYAENPLVAKDTNLYNNTESLLYKHGMVTSLIWRALRLVIDTGFHYYGYKRDWGRELFRKYAWMEGDIVEKELTRYQSNFGQATAYMIGQLHIHRLRNYTKEKLGEKFDIKDFHYQILSQGQAPLSYLEQQIEKYVECRLDYTAAGCTELLSSADERREMEKRYKSTGSEQFTKIHFAKHSPHFSQRSFF